MIDIGRMMTIIIKKKKKIDDFLKILKIQELNFQNFAI